MFWRKLRAFTLQISILLFGLGWYLSITGGYWVLQRSGLFGKESDFEYLTAWASDWNWWFLILGIFLIFVGGWYTFDTLRKIRKFERDINSESKKKFVSDLRELEEIAYKLGRKYEERLEEKKREWKIKH